MVSTRATMPVMNPALARSLCLAVLPSSTFRRTFRENTMPSTAQTRETIDEVPKLTTSRAAATTESTKPAIAGELPGAGGCQAGACCGHCWGCEPGGGGPGGGGCQLWTGGGDG